MSDDDRGLVKSAYRACKSCGARIVFASDPEGKTIPLHPAPPVYDVSVELSPEGFGERVVIIRARRNKDAMVTHFATCPNASQHSKHQPAAKNSASRTA